MLKDKKILIEVVELGEVIWNGIEGLACRKVFKDGSASFNIKVNDEYYEISNGRY